MSKSKALAGVILPRHITTIENKNIEDNSASSFCLNKFNLDKRQTQHNKHTHALLIQDLYKNLNIIIIYLVNKYYIK